VVTGEAGMGRVARVDLVDLNFKRFGVMEETDSAAAFLHLKAVEVR
jgi:hypothetical protein